MKKFVATIMIAAVYAAPALAAETGAYVGLDYAAYSMSGLNSGSSQPNAGFRIDGGYNFDKNWAAEVGYFISGNGTTPTAGQTFTPNTIYVSGVGTYPINDQFDILGKLGFASNSISQNFGNNYSNTDLMYGIGLDYNINKQFAVRAQYESLGKFTNNSTGNNVTGTDMSVGVIYKF